MGVVKMKPWWFVCWRPPAPEARKSSLSHDQHIRYLDLFTKFTKRFFCGNQPPPSAREVQELKEFEVSCVVAGHFWGELCSCRQFHTQKESWRSLRRVVWSQGSSHSYTITRVILLFWNRKRAEGVWGELCGHRAVHTQLYHYQGDSVLKQKESRRSLRLVVWLQGSSHTAIPLPGWPCCSETESWKSLRWVMWSQCSLHTAMPVWFCCSETESGRQKLEM